MNKPTTTGGRPINAFITTIKVFLPKKSLMLINVANGIDIRHDNNTAVKDTFKEIKIISNKLLFSEVIR